LAFFLAWMAQSSADSSTEFKMINAIRHALVISTPLRPEAAHRNNIRGALTRLSAALLLASVGVVSAQELTPRAYWPAPEGTNIAVLAYQRNTGDIVIDPSLPITGVESKIDYLQVGYQRFFSLFGRTATAQFNLPYADGFTEGFVENEFRQRTTTGLTDARLRLTINLRGAPAMDMAGFQALRNDPRTIIGASVIVQAPTGDYDDNRLINLGTNRWAIKPALGMIVPLHPTWLFEVELGVWLFGDNDDFLGVTREQEPIVSTEIHLIKRIRPGLWASLDANYYAGGKTRIGPEFSDDLQRNSRAGFTLVFPVQGRHAVRAGYSTGISTRSGGDFEMFSLTWAYAW
jgi:hypothetical protein